MFKKFRADCRVIPWAAFTDSEVARGGLNKSDAKEKNIPYELTTDGIDDLDRAIADSSHYCVVKVLTKSGKNKILGTIHIYPTISESNKYAAGEWKRAHQPEKLLAQVEKFHTWRCG